MRFLAAATGRSVEEAARRLSALIEITAWHALAFSRHPGPWPITSWLLAATHQGLLGERTTLGWANRITLARALLPALAPGRWSGVLAIASDLADGAIARRETPTAYGGFADPIADVAFWSWFGLRFERGPLRWAPVLTLALPAAAITAAYFVRGRSFDYPRPSWYRYGSAALQLWIAARALRKT